MLSRRKFIGASSVVLVGTACGVSKDGGAVRAAAGETTGDDKLPPSIAALTSVKDQATPISVEERRARLERARTLLGENKLDGLMMAGGTSLNYFTGMRWGNSERLTCVVIPVKGTPFIVTPKFEEERTIEQVKQGPLGAGTDVLTWQEDESPYALVAKGLRDRGISAGALGMEETVKFVFANGVARAAPALRIVSGTPVTMGCRMIKDAHELALMTLANQTTLKVYEAVYHAIAPGMTQQQVGGLISAAYGRMGFPGGASVQVGEYTASPHGSITPQTILEGHDHHDRRRLHGRGIPVRHHAHLRHRHAHRQDEAGVRDRARGADGGAQGGAPGCRDAGRGRRRPEGHRRRRATARTTPTSPIAWGTASAWTVTSGRISSAATP